MNTPIAGTLVFALKPDALFELIALGASLFTGGQVRAAALGPRAVAEEAARRGASKVFWLGEPAAGRIVDDYVPTLARIIETEKPGLVIFEGTKRGRAVAGRLSAKLDVTAMVDVLEFLTGADRELRARHMIFGGGAVRVDKPEGLPVIATAVPGIATASPVDDRTPGEVIEAPFIEPPWRVTLREVKIRPPATVDLGSAKRVVCAGRGLGKVEDLEMLQELARAIGAELACTRPLAEGLDWLPRERYIGISGATVRPDLYLGVGVSGQVQHQIGMNHSRVVVAVNKDPNAPIFQNADYGIAGDLYEIVPELLKALKAKR